MNGKIALERPFPIERIPDTLWGFLIFSSACANIDEVAGSVPSVIIPKISAHKHMRNIEFKNVIKNVKIAILISR